MNLLHSLLVAGGNSAAVPVALVNASAGQAANGAPASESETSLAALEARLGGKPALPAGSSAQGGAAVASAGQSGTPQADSTVQKGGATPAEASATASASTAAAATLPASSATAAADAKLLPGGHSGPVPAGATATSSSAASASGNLAIVPQSVAAQSSQTARFAPAGAIKAKAQPANPASHDSGRKVPTEETGTSVKNSSPASATDADVAEEATVRGGRTTHPAAAPGDAEDPGVTAPDAAADSAEGGDSSESNASAAEALSVNSSEAGTGKTNSALSKTKASSTNPVRDAGHSLTGAVEHQGGPQRTPAATSYASHPAVSRADGQDLGSAPKSQAQTVSSSAATTASSATSAVGFGGTGAASVAAAGSGARTGASTTPASVAEQVANAAGERAQLVHRGGSTRFYVRLEPPELGTIHVHLQSADGSVHARLVASSESARAALQSQLPDLRSRLGSAGVNVGGLDVSNGQAGSGQPSGSGADAQPAVRVAPPAPVRSIASTSPAAMTVEPGRVNVIA